MNSDQAAPDLHQRLLQAIGGEKPHAWGKRMGIEKATLDGIINHGSTPTTKTLLKIAWHSDISLNWLLTGQPPERLQSPSASQSLHEMRSLLLTPNRVGDEGEGYLVNKDAYVLVPRYDVAASAGPGFAIQSEQVVDHLAFKSEWVRRAMGLDPHRLALISTKGDSMEPSLKEGDLLLLDLREQQVRNDAIYVLRLDDFLIAKRLQRGFDGTITIKSDNTAYEKQVVPKEMTEQLDIIGRVVWTGRRI